MLKTIFKDVENADNFPFLKLFPQEDNKRFLKIFLSVCKNPH